MNQEHQKTISIRIGSLSLLRVTFCVIIAMDGTKLPIFLIFTGTAFAQIERLHANILQIGIRDNVQRKEWKDDRGMKMWSENI